MRTRTIVMATLVVLLCAFYTWKHYEFKPPAVVDVPYKTTDTIIPLPATILRDSITYFDVRIAEIDKEIEHREEMNSIIAQMIQDHIKINNQLRKINKDLREHLAGQSWKINPPDYSHDTGIVLPNLTYSVVDMPIRTGGSSVTIGPAAALGKGVTIRDSFATTGSNNAWTGTLIVDTVRRK